MKVVFVLLTYASVEEQFLLSRCMQVVIEWRGWQTGSENEYRNIVLSVESPQIQ